MCNEYFRAMDKKIANTNKEIEEINLINIDNNLKQILLSQLYIRKDELNKVREKMEKSYGKEQIKMILSGENIGKGEISIRTLSDTLFNMQNVIDCIANSISNTQNKNNRITNKIKESTEFILKEVFEGSFGMVIEAPFKPDMLGNKNVTTETCEKFFNLLLIGNNEEKLKNISSELGYKTINAYRDFLSKIKNNNSNLKFEFNSHSGERTFWNSDKNIIEETIRKIDTIKTEEEQALEKKGKLTKIDISKEEFSIVCEEEIINGNANYDILMDVHEFIDQEKIFYMTKKIYKQINTGKEDYEWILTGYKR